MKNESCPRSEFQERRLPFLEGFEVARLVVGPLVLPAAVQDADPLEGQSAEGGVTGHAPLPGALVEGPGPERLTDGAGRPLDEGLSQKRVAGVAPVDGALVAAAFGDGRHAGEALKRVRRWEAVALFTESRQE